MGKTLETIALVAVEVGIAVFAPELLPASWSLLAVTAATAAAEIAVGLAANALIGPTVPKGIGQAVNNQVQRLFVTMDTTAPRKIVFGGTTAGATDLRYQSYTGTNQRYYEQIIAIASHQVNAITEIWLDNEKAWTSAGGAQGRFAGFLTVNAITLGTSSNGIAIDSTWTTSCTLTGCAYVRLKFDLLGNASSGSTNNSPFASGVTSRVTIRTQGALVYDPRLDSTVSGGSGSQRAATQSTWAWDSNASRNPALQLLFYLLGWQINGKLAVGMGLPAARIDLASFAVAANACDASITLNGGGTEPRYRSDGVVTEGDDRQSVIEAMCATMNAVLRDAGGKLSLTVLSNDLASPVASFTEADILSGEQWDQTPALSDTFNICRGRRVDPSDTSLYQLVDVPEASLTSNDGIDRIDTMDMPFVQSNGQAQRLLKQRLQRKQYQGKYSFTGNARWWQVSLGDIVQLSHAGLGWSNKLFRVAGQTISRDGTTKMVLIEENAAIYAWSNNESAAVTPGTPTIYDPANAPLGSGIAASALTSIVISGPASSTVSADSTGTIKSGQLPKDIQFHANAGVTDYTTLGTWSFTQSPVGGLTGTMGASTGDLNVTALNVKSVIVTASFVYGFVTRTFTHTISRVDDPPTSTGGTGSTGGTTATTTTLGATTSTAYDTTNAVSAQLTATAGSGGQVQCVAPVSFLRSASTVGSQDAWGKWQWRVVGGTFADITTEVKSTTSAQNINEPPLTKYDGFLNVTMTKTGLTNGTSYQFRFLWRNDSGATALNYDGGTLTATGS